MILGEKINILFMPTDSCNMNCIYCFNQSNHKKRKKMDIETLKKSYQIIFKSFSDVTLVWHGGEPLSVGIDFFRSAIGLQKIYNDIKISNRIQTNLTLLNDEWIEFFKINNFGLGSSFDGTKNESTRGYTNIIMSNSDLLYKRGIKHSFIMVVSNYNIDTLIDSYNFFKEHKKSYTINMYLPSERGDKYNLKLNPEYTIRKICEFFDYWLYDTDANICIRYFDMFINFILLKKKNVCNFTSCLGRWIGIKYNGEIVPCNRYFPKEYSFGNVWDYESINEAFESQGFIKLLSQAVERREKCKECEVFNMCAGGCNNVALIEGGISENGGDSCKILIGVYRHIDKKLSELKSQINDAKVNSYVKEKLKQYKELVKSK